MTDPIGDMLIRIKNGYLAKHKTVSMPCSKFREELGRLLVKNGYLGDLKVESNKKKTKKTITVRLKYKAKRPAVEGVKRISKPGLRIYTDVRQLKKLVPGLGVTIISTNQGLLTLEEAKKTNQGGEVICKVW
jgi:small subunit ribosomal protein S8